MADHDRATHTSAPPSPISVETEREGARSPLRTLSFTEGAAALRPRSGSVPAFGVGTAVAPPPAEAFRVGLLRRLDWEQREADSALSALEAQGAAGPERDALAEKSARAFDDARRLEDPAVPLPVLHEIAARRNVPLPPGLAGGLKTTTGAAYTGAGLTFSAGSVSAPGLTGGPTSVVTTGSATVGLGTLGATTAETRRKVGPEGSDTKTRSSKGILDLAALSLGLTQSEEHVNERTATPADTPGGPPLTTTEASSKVRETRLSTGGLARSEVETYRSDSQAGRREASTAVTRGEGVLGVARTRAGSFGTVDETGALVAGHQTSATSAGGLVVAPQTLGAQGALGGSATTVHAKGVKTGVTGGVDGRFTVAVTEVPKTSPPEYLVVLTLKLGVGAGASGSADRELKQGGSRSGGAEAKAAGAGTLQFTRRLSADLAAAWQDGLAQAAAGKAPAGDHPELALLAKGASEGWDTTAALVNGLAAGVGSPAAAKGLSEGDCLDLTLSASASAGLGVGRKAAGGLAVGVKAGASGATSLRRRVLKREGKVVVTLEARDQHAVSGGATGGLGLVSLGAEAEGGQDRGQAVTVVLDPAQPTFDRRFQRVMAAVTIDDLRAVAGSFGAQAVQHTESSGTSTGGKESAALGPVKLELAHGARQSAELATSAQGEALKQVGSSALGASVTVGGATVGARRDDQLATHVDEKGKATAELTTTRTATDLDKTGAALDARLADRKASLASGAVKVLEASAHVTGVHLEDADFATLEALAEKRRDWDKGHPSPRQYEAWMDCREAVLAADGDRRGIAAALTAFVGSDDHGRVAVIDRLLGRPEARRGGSRYEWPDELTGMRESYETLVFGDPVAAVKASAATSTPDKAREELRTAFRSLVQLRATLQVSADAFTNLGVYGEMLERTSTRLLEVREALREADERRGPVVGDAERARERYDTLVADCRTFKRREAALFDEIGATHFVDSLFSGRQRARPDAAQATANVDRLNQLHDLYQRWEPMVAELPGLATRAGLGAVPVGLAPDRVTWSAYNRGQGPATAP